MGDSSPESDIEEPSSASSSSSTSSSSSPSSSPASRGQKKTTSPSTMWGSSSSQGWPPVTGGQGGPPQGAAGPSAYNWSSSMGWEAAGSAGGGGGSSWNERQPGWNLQQPGILTREKLGWLLHQVCWQHIKLILSLHQSGIANAETGLALPQWTTATALIQVCGGGGFASHIFTMLAGVQLTFVFPSLYYLLLTGSTLAI